MWNSIYQQQKLDSSGKEILLQLRPLPMRTKERGPRKPHNNDTSISVPLSVPRA